MSPPPTNPAETYNRQLFCKACKNLFAPSVNGELKIMRTETKCNCKICLNPNLGDHYNMQQKYELIKNMDQKEPVFDFYKLYARLRGFDMENVFFLQLSGG